MNSVPFVCLFLAALATVLWADNTPMCVLWEAVIHPAPNYIDEKKITARDILKKEKKIETKAKDCSRASDIGCYRELVDDWMLLKTDLKSTDAANVTAGTRYCEQFHLRNIKDHYIAAFYDLTGCHENLTFYNMISQQEFCCNSKGVYDCSFPE